MATTSRFSAAVLARIDDAKIVGIRAGAEHRYTGIWIVVVNGRVFGRSWNDKATGWRRAFRDEPQGTLQVPGRRPVRVRARPVRGERLLASIDDAYAAKYDTPASQKWVRGFARGKRRLATMEFTPA